jgi:hypothetical protein
MADFIVGSVVRDDDFWFRGEFLSELWSSLEKHNAILVAETTGERYDFSSRLLKTWWRKYYGCEYANE